MTITTTGCGDRYPATTKGRMTAVLRLMTGVGILGMFTGFASAW